MYRIPLCAAAGASFHVTDFFPPAAASMCGPPASRAIAALYQMTVVASRLANEWRSVGALSGGNGVPGVITDSLARFGVSPLSGRGKPRKTHGRASLSRVSYPAACC
jgi:hypothetical protein